MEFVEVVQRFFASTKAPEAGSSDLPRSQYHELATPVSSTFFTRAPQGAIYGLEATPQRFMSPRLGTRLPIKNMYMAGGDVAVLGVTGAMIGGELAACTIQPRAFTRLL